MMYGLKSASAIVLLSIAGCAMTSKAPDFSGLKDVDGSDAVHINMTKAALHFAVALPFIGDASLEGAVRDFTEEAKRKERSASGSCSPMRPRYGGSCLQSVLCLRQNLPMSRGRLFSHSMIRLHRNTPKLRLRRE